MYELLRSFWLPFALIVATFARIPFGVDWVGAFTLLLIGAGVGVGIQAMHAHLNDPEIGEDPRFPLGDWWIWTLAGFAILAIASDVAILAAPLVGALAGRFGYLHYA